ncbi:hypothetical protein CF9_0146 [Staphylococcus phage CF9]|uniref:Uncharacterized protein n=1 Tax=Staphylococcus phage CF9 TaxID=3113741 RepID=A0AAX4J6F7_9CAUD|nr:hypothetical protein CF9_0146 [Staphylococcus phage CF9]
MYKKNFNNDSVKVDIDFHEFKVEDKILYCINLEDILKHLNLKKDKIVPIVKSIKRKQKNIIMYKDSKYYLSQTGYELLLKNLKGRNRKHRKSSLILGKYRNKNNKNKNIAYVPKDKGIKHDNTELNNIPYSVLYGQIYYSHKVIADILDTNEKYIFEICEDLKNDSNHIIQKENETYIIKDIGFCKIMNELNLDYTKLLLDLYSMRYWSYKKFKKVKFKNKKRKISSFSNSHG